MWRYRSGSCVLEGPTRLFARGCKVPSSNQQSAYNPSQVESKWQKKWQQESGRCPGGIDNQLGPEDGSKYYVLSMFPYPSGHLHIGHVRVYTISDTLAHYNRMKGKKVIHPMGWDSFGLPAENAAIDQGINPVQWTNENIEVMRAQLNTLGCHFDWSREVATSSPDYYKWTQWIFLQLYKHGLAYKKKALVNWDPVDQTVLANEQVDSDGNSWRSGAKVEQRYLDQWFFQISSYAEALLAGLDDLDWPDQVKGLQRAWIGKSEGAYFDFKVQGGARDTLTIRAFTTQPDTVYGVSFLAVSPDHEVLKEAGLLDSRISQQLEELGNVPTTSYKRRGDREGVAGVDLGITALHPFTGAAIPVFAANYVVSEYGTGALMGVPAHDRKDRLFADHHDLPSVTVNNSSESEDATVLLNSQQFSGMTVSEGVGAIVEHAASLGVGGHMTQYKIRDWLVSRQRYWGAPIPILYCDQCGIVPVREDQLPVKLPMDVQLHGRGPSPLAQARDWRKATCGKPGCCALRETDTIDTFVDSSWYFLRYINPRDSARAFTEDALQWMPVDVYIGGIEHAVLHLLYARFITHFLHDIGLLRTREPFQKLLTQGMVQGKTFRERSTGRYLTKAEQTTLARGAQHVKESWEKMSKSKFNGADPEEVINQYGADTVRIFMLFKAPPEMSIQWDIRAIKGAHRWLNRVWALTHDHMAAVCNSSTQEGRKDTLSKQLLQAQNKAIKQVTQHLDQHTYNVAIAELMTFSNKLRDFRRELLGTPVFHRSLAVLCTLLAPMAPHIASELWEALLEAGEGLDTVKPAGNVLQEKWPCSNEDLLVGESRTVVLQVNGIKKGTVSVGAELCEQINRADLQDQAIKAAVDQRLVKNSESVTKIYVSHNSSVVNFVVDASV